MADPIELERHLTIDGTEYDVAQLEAREALDEIGVLRCEITDRAGGPDPAALIDKTLVLKLSRKPGRWNLEDEIEALPGCRFMFRMEGFFC